MPTLNQALKLQDRDFALLRGLFESRLMTAAHVSSLYFDGRREATKKRLQKLKVEGLIGERTRRAYEPSLLFLSPKGLAVLKDRGVLAEYPALTIAALQKRVAVSPLTLAHELEVMDVKVAFHVSLRGTRKFSVAEFTTWPFLNQFEAIRGGHGGKEVIVK